MQTKGEMFVYSASVMIQGMYSVLDTVSKWVLYNNVREVMVFDGIAVEGLPDSKRIPIVLSSNGREADEANLIHDYNIDATMEIGKGMYVLAEYEKIKRITMPFGDHLLLYLATEVEADHSNIYDRIRRLEAGLKY